MTICRTTRPTRTATVSAPATPCGLDQLHPAQAQRRSAPLALLERRLEAPVEVADLPDEEPGDEPGEDEEGDVEHHLGDAGPAPLDPEGPVDVGGRGRGRAPRFPASRRRRRPRARARGSRSSRPGSRRCLPGPRPRLPPKARPPGRRPGPGWRLEPGPRPSTPPRDACRVRTRPSRRVTSARGGGSAAPPGPGPGAGRRGARRARRADAHAKRWMRPESPPKTHGGHCIGSRAIGWPGPAMAVGRSRRPG